MDYFSGFPTSNLGNSVPIQLINQAGCQQQRPATRRTWPSKCISAIHKTFPIYVYVMFINELVLICLLVYMGFKTCTYIFLFRCICGGTKINVDLVRVVENSSNINNKHLAQVWPPKNKQLTHFDANTVQQCLRHK